MMSYNSQGGTGPKAVQAMINDMRRDLEQKTKVWLTQRNNGNISKLIILNSYC